MIVGAWGVRVCLVFTCALGVSKIRQSLLSESPTFKQGRDSFPKPRPSNRRAKEHRLAEVAPEGRSSTTARLLYSALSDCFRL